MTKLGQVCFSSNLITITVHWSRFWVGATDTALFIYRFQGCNLQGDDEDHKRGTPVRILNKIV